MLLSSANGEQLDSDSVRLAPACALEKRMEAWWAMMRGLKYVKQLLATCPKNVHQPWPLALK